MINILNNETTKEKSAKKREFKPKKRIYSK